MVMQRYVLDYRHRLRLAVVGSAVFHGIILILMGWHVARSTLGLGAGREPIVLNLQPEPPRPARRFVDSLVPAQEAVRPTDRISTQDANAADLSERIGEDTAPLFDEVSDFDKLAPPALASLPRPPVPEPSVPEPVETAEALPQESPAALAVRPPPPERPVDAAPEEPLDAGEADAGPSPDTSQGRVSGGVKNKGFLSFEAMRHELGPYMKEVRDRVERRWLTALELRYPGAWSTKATLDCAISPEGKLVYVTIVDPGDTATYAPLCRDAIEKAAPFPPFPFTVPELYRTKNLEIRWTFSFM